jgi:hypothetical protein
MDLYKNEKKKKTKDYNSEVVTNAANTFDYSNNLNLVCNKTQ